MRWRCGSISRIGARFARRGPKRGSVVITTPPAELHSAPVAIAANLLRWAGFNAIELGADTPADALAQTLADGARPAGRRHGLHHRCLDHLGPSSHHPSAPALPGITVLIGGAAIADADQALRLGADGFSGRRGDDLVRAVEALVAARSDRASAVSAAPSGAIVTARLDRVGRHDQAWPGRAGRR